MKTRKLLLPSIFLVVTIIAYIVASLAFCYTTKPEISEGEFPFSVTYEYKGETGTLSGIYKCNFSGSSTIAGEHKRHWDGESIIEYDGEYDIPNVIYQDETMSLAVFENMSAGYFMGDPLYADRYIDYGYDAPHPNIEYYDYVNDVSLNEENREEILEEIGFELIDFTYPEPIDNSFSLSGIRYEADNLIIFTAILLLFMLACLIFVRRDKEYKYSALDKAGIVLNFIMGIFAIPFIAIICFFFGIVESNLELINQITYSIPPFAILCLGLSVVFRRKGFSKTGFFIQFAGLVPFILLLILDVV